MLILARESRGITQQDLAKKLGVTQGWLSRIEGGLRSVQKEDLMKFSEMLNYPPEFFFLEDKVYGPGLSELFHRKRQSVQNKLITTIYAQIGIRSLHIQRLLNGVNIGTVYIKHVELDDFEGNPADIARVVRASWRLPKGPIQNLVNVIEDARGIIIPFDFNSASIDAISHWQPELPPLFFINKFTPMDRVRFTLSHELGHIIMHQSYVNADIEHQADQFAAEFLMPEKEIRPYLADLSLEKLATLKQYWHVSMNALLHRASDLGEITPRHARTLWTQLGKAGYRTREPRELDVPREKPSLLNEILQTYLVDMKYSVKELARYLCLFEHEIRNTYITSDRLALETDKKAAIKEAERIISDFHKNT